MVMDGRSKVVMDFHTIKSILNQEELQAENHIKWYFHTIKSILN